MPWRAAILLAAAFAFLTISCASRPPAIQAFPVIAIEIVPNPIIAYPAAGGAYRFPFEIVVRETGGAAAHVTRVSLNVVAFGALQVYSQEMMADEIRQNGFSPDIAAGGELRYRFNPTKKVPDERLFSGVTAHLRVEAVDENGEAVPPATAEVTLRKQR
ncbi:MAG: hypothetical protein ABI718_16495 [Acidobacteriota bacterium]